MKILAIDTTSEVFSAALYSDGKIITEEVSDKKHTPHIMEAVSRLCGKSGILLDDIDVFGVNPGPGSFTGIRCGVAAMQAFSKCLNTPLAGVDSFKNLSYGISGTVCAMIDARNERVFAALRKNMHDLIEPGIYEVNEIQSLCRQYDTVITGNGAQIYRDFFEHLVCVERFYPHAENICRIIAEASGDYSSLIPEPLYLKKSHPEEKAHV